MASSRGGGGSGGMRFALRFEVEGAGKRELANILKTMRQVSAAAAGVGGVGGGVGGRGGRGRNSGGPVDLAKQFQELAKQIYYVNPAVGRFAFGLASMQKLNDSLIPGIAGLAAAFIGLSVGSQVLEAVNAAGMTLISWGSKGVGTIIGIGRGIMETVGPIETALTQIKLLAGLSNSQALDVMGNIQEIVKFTPFQQGELTTMTQGLIMGKVGLENWTDAAGKAITLQDALNQGFARSEVPEFAREMKISATSIMADFAALTGNVGERAATFNRGIQRLFSTGSARLLTDQVNQEALTALVGKAGTLQLQGTADDAMQRIYKYLQEKQAVGMAAIASGTWEGLKSNVAEIPMLFAQAIGGLPGSGGLYDKLLAGLQNIYNEVNKFLSNKAAMGAIRDALVPVFEFLLSVATKLTSILTKLANFVTTNPFLMKLVVWGTLLGGAFLVLTGVSLVLASAIGSVVLVTGMAYLAFRSLRILLTNFWPIVLRTATAVLTLGAAVTGAMLLTAALTALGGVLAYFIVSSEPFQRFWENTKLVITAAGEALSNWSNGMTEISGETAGALERAGLMGFFMKVIGWFRSIELWWDRTTDTLSVAWERFSARLQRPIEVFSQYLSEAFSAVSLSLGMATGDVDSFGSQSDSTILKVVGSLGDLLAAVLTVGIGFLTFVKPFVEVALWLDIIRVGFSATAATMVAEMNLIGSAIMEGIVAPFMLVANVVKMIGGVLSADTVGERVAAVRDFANAEYFSSTRKAYGEWKATDEAGSLSTADAWLRFDEMRLGGKRSYRPDDEPSPMADPSGYYGMDIGTPGYSPFGAPEVQAGSNAALLGPAPGVTRIETTNQINVVLDGEVIASRVERNLKDAKERLLGKDDLDI